MKFLVSAAGTGGHVFPAMKFCQECITENHEVIFLDGTGSVATPSYSFNMNYVGDGPIIVGAHYQGAMHDLRVWTLAYAPGRKNNVRRV